MIGLKTSKNSKFQFSQEVGHTWHPGKADVAFSLNMVIYLIYIIY